MDEFLCALAFFAFVVAQLLAVMFVGHARDGIREGELRPTGEDKARSANGLWTLPTYRN